MRLRAVLFAIGIALAAPALAQEGGNGNPAQWPGYQAGDYTINNYKFASGETLPELKLHYLTLGTPHRNAAGQPPSAATGDDCAYPFNTSSFRTLHISRCRA